MNPNPAPIGATADLATSQLVVEVFESSPPEVQNKMLTELVGRVYEAAPPVVRSRLIGHLMQPLGLLSLLALANGVFANIRFRGGWQGTAIPLSEVDSINARDVLALVDFVQQVSRDAVNGLAQVLATSPAMSSTAAAAVLMTVLMRRARQRRATDIARSAPGG
jgi:hypothetical protein